MRGRMLCEAQIMVPFLVRVAHALLRAHSKLASGPAACVAEALQRRLLCGAARRAAAFWHALNVNCICP